MARELERHSREESRRAELAPVLETIVEKERANARFDGKISIDEAVYPRLKAHTNMETKQTEISYADSYAEQHPERLYAFARDAALHEMDHHRHNGFVKGYRFKGCPRNIDLATKSIYEPICEILLPNGFSPNDARYLENSLEDTILHSDLSPAYSLNGISHFFKEVGESSKFSSMYEAHVRLNLMLWGSAPQLKSLKSHFSRDKKEKEKIDCAIKEFIEKSGLSGLKLSFLCVKSPKVSEERLKIREFLNNENNWPEISRAYAEAFSKLMTPNYALPLLNHSGAGTKGREEEDSSNEGNQFQRQREAREYKRGRIEEAHKSGKGAPNWIDHYEAMDLLYEGLAKRLAFDVKTFTENDTMPILHYGERRFNPRTDSLSHISFGFDSSGRLEIRKKPYSIDMQIPVKQSTIGFPKARMVFLDTSGSMKLDFNNRDEVGSKLIVSWGDKSKYHGALVEWYGFLEWLKENHLLERTGIDLVNIGDETLVGRGLEAAKKLALKPQFGKTLLDSSKINELFRGKGTFIATISDGEINNWNGISEQFLKGVSDNYYVHLQIGAESKMCDDIRKAGGLVETIRTADELRGRTIKIADKFYRHGRELKEETRENLI